MEGYWGYKDKSVWLAFIYEFVLVADRGFPNIINNKCPRGWRKQMWKRKEMNVESVERKSWCLTLLYYEYLIIEQRVALLMHYSCFVNNKHGQQFFVVSIGSNATKSSIHGNVMHFEIEIYVSPILDIGALKMNSCWILAWKINLFHHLWLHQ